MRCCAHVGHGIAVSVQSGVLALSLSRGITILGVGGGLGLPAGSSETELRAVGFWGVSVGVFLATQVDFFSHQFPKSVAGGRPFSGRIFFALLDNNIGNAM